MALAKPRSRRRGEPTIALINIVFLMLVFFLIAGTVAPPLDSETTLANTNDLDGRPPPDAAVIRADGTLIYRGAEITSEAYLEERLAEAGEGRAMRLVPDRDLPAQRLLEIANVLRAGGAREIWVVTERGLE